jgi:hypothetical protein
VKKNESLPVDNAPAQAGHQNRTDAPIGFVKNQRGGRKITLIWTQKKGENRHDFAAIGTTDAQKRNILRRFAAVRG